MASPSRVRLLGATTRPETGPWVFCGGGQAANQVMLLSERHTSPGSAEAKSHGSLAYADPLTSHS